MEHCNYNGPIGSVTEECSPVSRLPKEVVSFNPSVAESVDMLLFKYGPEGVYEMAQVLLKAACDDMDINNTVPDLIPTKRRDVFSMYRHGQVIVRKYLSGC
jgi:hypothetical protein